MSGWKCWIHRYRRWRLFERGKCESGWSSYILDERPDLTLGPVHFALLTEEHSLISDQIRLFLRQSMGNPDMHGNVMEWCFDYYGNYSDTDLLVDPIGQIRGSKKVVRGGSFYRTAQECRSASRACYEPSYRGSEIGFRYVIGSPLR